MVVLEVAVRSSKEIVNVSIAVSPAIKRKIAESQRSSSKEEEVKEMEPKAAEAAAAAVVVKVEKLRQESATNSKRMGNSLRIAEARKLVARKLRVGAADQRNKLELTPT